MLFLDLSKKSDYYLTVSQSHGHPFLATVRNYSLPPLPPSQLEIRVRRTYTQVQRTCNWPERTAGSQDIFLNAKIVAKVSQCGNGLHKLQYDY